MNLFCDQSHFTNDHEFYDAKPSQHQRHGTQGQKVQKDIDNHALNGKLRRNEYPM
jgi:hypothetical protein